MPLSPEKIAALMNKRGVTRSELARLVDMPRQHIGGYIDGKRLQPSLDVAERLAKALRVKVDAILSDALPPGGEGNKRRKIVNPTTFCATTKGGMVN